MNRVEGQYQVPRPADHVSFDVVQDMAGCVGSEDTHCLLLSNLPFTSVPKPISAGLSFIFYQLVLIMVVAVTQEQDLALGFLNLVRFTWTCCSAWLGVSG